MSEDLEERLFELKQEYEKPADVPKLKKVKPERYGPTITEKMSDFWQNNKKFALNALAGIATITLVGYFFVYPAVSELTKSLESSLTPLDNGQNYTVSVINLKPIFPFPYGFSKYPSGVYISDSDGSNTHLLTQEIASSEWRQAELSPDENKVALVEVNDVINPYCNLFVINTDGSRLSQLANNENSECDHDPFWVDSDTIAFVRGNGEAQQVMMIDIDANNVGYNLRSYEPVN